MNGDIVKGDLVYWKDSKVNVIHDKDITKQTWETIYECYCIDTDYLDNKSRYGKYNNGWHHIPFEDFPPEFKATLLIMGIT